MFEISRDWTGETAVIFGGGPSLSVADIRYTIERGFKRVACNDVYILDPLADALVAGDSRWWAWNAAQVVKTFKGKYIFAWKSVPPTQGLSVRQLKHRSGTVSHDPGSVCANNSGSGAINIAYLFGAKRILLLGFDMRAVNGQHNWHKRHLKGTKPQVYTGAPPITHGGFIPQLTRASKEYAARGVEIINCTAGSELKCFPFISLRDIR